MKRSQIISDHQQEFEMHVYVRVVPPLPNLLGGPSVGVGAHLVGDVDPANVGADLAIGIQLHHDLFEALVLLCTYAMDEACDDTSR